ncbi:glucose 1-dehydrogenase [Sphingoaurantiacus capsulatus]|uniref:Glucose 1-dehydrogenase n=1 Tax=Sphingoaurantiacus capsulatus TaxID=1771310 RepID=A0ABV7XDL4_9SPHN
MSSGRLAGKIALVTGGASGLGAATARKFAAEGARVLLTDIDTDGAARVAADIGDAAASCRHDVTSEADWQAAVAEAEAKFGGLHILVNNAGIAPAGTVEDTSLEEWRRVHAIDLDGVFLGCKLALPLIAATTAREGSRGSILNVSSIAGIIAAANMAAYNSAKAAVRHLTKSVALHCAKERYAVTCNSIHPTFIDTPIIDKMIGDRDRAQLLAKFARQVPVGRVGEPDDVAFAALYLCSDEAKFVTGAELYIDGGIAAM